MIFSIRIYFKPIHPEKIFTKNYVNKCKSYQNECTVKCFNIFMSAVINKLSKMSFNHIYGLTRFL